MPAGQVGHFIHQQGRREDGAEAARDSSSPAPTPPPPSLPRHALLLQAFNKYRSAARSQLLSRRLLLISSMHHLPTERPNEKVLVCPETLPGVPVCSGWEKFMNPACGDKGAYIRESRKHCILAHIIITPQFNIAENRQETRQLRVVRAKRIKVLWTRARPLPWQHPGALALRHSRPCTRPSKYSGARALHHTSPCIPPSKHPDALALRHSSPCTPPRYPGARARHHTSPYIPPSQYP
ncbi:hypothetical protein NDU88_005847 [Pleurodeles waltl]|uniref:Kazal-like domain-containing protein n=1 Tax=Pleurodeles waltl TaxID=8319 RepID=A0AAV7L2I5_PLEWA|nr:hypothetical protein NDU88_005847 [Pleurodeles waltl]